MPYDEARSLEPMDLSSAEPWRQTLAGDDGAFCRVRSGHVDCWGRGYGTSTTVAEIGDALEVFVWDEHGCVFRRGGRLSCWRTSLGRPGELSFLPTRLLRGAIDWEHGGTEGCAIGAEGVLRCYVLCDDIDRCGRFELQPWSPGDVALVAVGRQCPCVMSRAGVVSCAGYNCEEWTGFDGAAPHVLQGLSGTLLFRGHFEYCTSRGDGRLLCRGGGLVKPAAPNRREATRTTTVIVPLPPQMSPPVRGVRISDWVYLIHRDGELSRRLFDGRFERVDDLPGPVRQVVGDAVGMCLELFDGRVFCKPSDQGSDYLEMR